MNFNKHSELEGKHSVLSASNNSWTSYTAMKMAESYDNGRLKYRGTLWHEVACNAILYSIDLSKYYVNSDQAKLVSKYVHDCIRDEMTPEVVLYYSRNAFGTSDAIKYDEENRILYVYDLKTGKRKAKPKQLYIYAAYFCLEYNHHPEDLSFHFRIYQNDSVGPFYSYYTGDSDTVRKYMDIIRALDIVIEKERNSHLDWSW